MEKPAPKNNIIHIPMTFKISKALLSLFAFLNSIIQSVSPMLCTSTFSNSLSTISNIFIIETIYRFLPLELSFRSLIGFSLFTTVLFLHSNFPRSPIVT